MINLSDLNKTSYNVIGVMSGTSLDGLDICLCSFKKNDEKWAYQIHKAITLNYTDEIKGKLTSVFTTSGLELTKFDYDYGRWIGIQIKAFTQGIDTTPDFIASHGHTIYHKPNEGYTLQIGKGAAIAAESGLPCICDFRSSDVCRSGQGAPLVPIGDKFLFSEYDICLNLGGFANLSYEYNNNRLAFDIGPCNIILNSIAQEMGYSFDCEGNLGKIGSVNESLLSSLNALDYYHKDSPKSLGREWVESTFAPIIKDYNISPEDKLSTVYEHISQQICIVTNRINGKNILITGGGTHNGLLIHLIRNKSNHSIVTPDNLTIDFKEALIFAFLGVLYIQKQYSALASVTGASTNSISGCLYY
ncbi:MAG: anhydro-N-acetylmuramic acid kinase [Bacteroidales bacterium]|nr:MAG: anhydro-N-acetylmuramic acid kinase [Bacteroidales bacterium]